MNDSEKARHIERRRTFCQTLTNTKDGGTLSALFAHPFLSLWAESY